MRTKKDLKEEYKQMRFTMGVFQIRNTTNDKIFIDSSNNINAKWSRHKLTLNFGNHINTELQRDWKELGEDAFVFELLSELKHDDTKNIDYQSELKQLEEMFIEELLPFGEKGYNKSPNK